MARVHSMMSQRGCAMLLVAICLGGSGCAATLPPAAFANGGPAMRPEIFFAGTTSSSGVLENRSGAPTRLFQVEGVGKTLPDGSFRLDQRISFEHEAPETRSWVMRRLDSHSYTATLSDASGPAEGEAYGNLLHLRYPMKRPFGGEMEQWLYLQPDGCTVMNEATVSVFGIVVAHLSERISRAVP